MFIGDIYDKNGTLDTITKAIKIIAYIILLVSFFYSKRTLKEIFTFSTFFIVSLTFFVTTRDLYWSILALFIINAIDCDSDSLFKIGIFVMTLGSLVTLTFCFLGILPDVMTSRDHLGIELRHSFGFYHSNVLPLLVLYIEIYYIFIYQSKAKHRFIVLMLFINYLLNIMCNSRNAFYLCAILSFAVIYIKHFPLNKYITKSLTIITKYSVLLMSIFSYAMIFLLLRGGVYDKIDSFFSGRFRNAIFKMRSVGIHLVTFMSNEDYFRDGITLDNGYLYIILRYGIVMVIFFVIVNYFLVNKVGNNPFALIALLVLFIANFIDNDLVDYGFFPFIIFTFNRANFIERISAIRQRKKLFS